MLLTAESKEDLNTFFTRIRLKNSSEDQNGKIEQILAYLEVIHSSIRKLSRSRELVFIDSGAGNCYLSFLVYYFYAHIDKRKVTIHCIDRNERLMVNCREKASSFGFLNMYFHACDISEVALEVQPDLVFSLHACDTATDQALYLGVKLGARNILSVSCCQHSLAKDLRKHPWTGITRHAVFKDRILYMVADSMRVLLLESNGYDADIIEFVSSRYTDKNIMIRARRTNRKGMEESTHEYERIRKDFHIRPYLEQYVKNLS